MIYGWLISRKEINKVNASKNGPYKGNPFAKHGGKK